MSVNNVGGAGSVQMMSIEGLDLESSLMAVQTNRVNLLDQQLKDQMGAVQNRNNRINELNVGMTAMNKALANVAGTAAGDPVAGADLAAFVAGAPQVVDVEATQAAANNVPTIKNGAIDVFDNLQIGSQYSPTDSYNFSAVVQYAHLSGVPLPDAMQQIATKYSINSEGDTPSGDRMTLTADELAVMKGFCANAALELRNQPLPNQSPIMKADPEAAACGTRAKAEAYIKGQQSQIDALGNTQQMDMLRLQSLSNKRNEAFEIMTNFMKKLADSRSGIISKMG